MAAVLGEAIRKARRRAGLTQEELAFRASISRNYVSLLELDQKSPTVETLMRVAGAVGTKASTLLEKVERQLPAGGKGRTGRQTR